eukprot:8598321-Alexandrium_andersonii.AAC.1
MAAASGTVDQPVTAPTLPSSQLPQAGSGPCVGTSGQSVLDRYMLPVDNATYRALFPDAKPMVDAGPPPMPGAYQSPAAFPSPIPVSATSSPPTVPSLDAQPFAGGPSPFHAIQPGA